MTVPVVLAIAGAVVLLVGVLGGGIKAREIEIPSMPMLGRVIASIAGLALIGVSIWLSSILPIPTAVSPTLTPETSAAVDTPIPTSEGIFMPDPTKMYLIRSVLSQKVLGIDGSAVVQSDWAAEPSQEWTFEPLSSVDDSYYFIHSAKSGDCLDVSGSTLIDGGEIIVYGCNGTDNQKWRIIAVNAGVVYLEVKHSQKVMDLPNSSTENGIQIVQYSFHGHENQQWIITPVTP